MEGLEAEVDVGGFLHDVDGVEGFYWVGSYGEDTVFAPEYDVVFGDGAGGGSCQAGTAGFEVGHYVDAFGAEEARLG